MIWRRLLCRSAIVAALELAQKTPEFTLAGASVKPAVKEG
jgi:hypothetical protein